MFVRVNLLKLTTKNVGARTKVKVVKNKVAPPFKTAEFDLMYGEGISKAGTLIDIGTNMEIINKIWCMVFLQWGTYGSR